MKVLRNGEQDAWSDILSTAAAGAFFGRKGKLPRISRHAVLVVVVVAKDWPNISNCKTCSCDCDSSCSLFD